MTNRQAPQNYRGFSIEQELSGNYSLYRFGYVAGHFASVEDAKRSVDDRLA